MGTKRILIVDDEKIFCEFVKINLELTGGFKVDVAANGKDGLKLAKRLRPDLILLDIVMPGLNGLMVLERLKKDKDTMAIPVIMLSASDDEAFKVKAAQLYGEVYITKPIEASELKDKLDEVLQRKGAA